MGATARDCPIGVEIGIGFFWCCCCYVHEFSPNLGKGVCVFGVCVLFWGIFLSVGVCVECIFFVPKYHKCLGISWFIFV